MSKVLMYQLWPLSWGNIRIMTSFLPRIAKLGCDYVWLSSIFESPCKNHGRDVSDYYAINSRLGTIADFNEFTRAAHALDLKVILDLPIDSTSIECNWLFTEPYKYIWSRVAQPSRQNLIGRNDSAWQPSGDNNYLCLDNPYQANLNWFHSEVLNKGLVEVFKKIMCYWLTQGVDGFRIGYVQVINENIAKAERKFTDLLIGKRAVQVVQELSNLYEGKPPFLIMDVFDNEFGNICNFYAEETDIEFITNKALKSTAISRRAQDPLCGLKKKVSQQVKNRKFMLELESADAPRFCSRSGVKPEKILDFMFHSGARAICLYQGQELGLQNPENLSMEEVLRLDLKAAYQYETQRISPDMLKKNSCANARIPIPLDEYARQEADLTSVLHIAIALIDEWKRSG